MSTDEEDGTIIRYTNSQPIRLRNVVCVYCGVRLTDGNSTKEHVVGRRFVPLGKLDGQWNLIVGACSPCNTRKSDLEDDIAAVSMQPDVFGRYAVADEALVATAKRKAARSTSRKTKKPVKESHARLAVSGQLSPVLTADFSFTGPPQIDDHRIFELARHHVMAFFFLITYDRKTERGGWWPGEFMPILHARRSDWGNVSWIGFMQNV